jgi:hypothetical protein
VNTLKPFSNEKVKFLLEADAQLSASSLKLQFCLIDKGDLFNLPVKNVNWSSEQIPFKEELWNQTCFEAFLNPVGMPHYYEFNFTLAPAWSTFYFERYRYPQPPKKGSDFELQSMSWDQFESTLTVELKNNSKFKKFNVGLAAVLNDNNGTQHFCALTHKGQKPDFHLFESFSIVRG